MIVSDRVGERMQAIGLSQSELARRVGVAQPTIYKLLRSSKKGSTHLHRIARELGTTPAYLTGEVDDPDADAPPPPVLTFAESEWVELYRQLNEDQQHSMMRILRDLVGVTRGPAPTLHSPSHEFRHERIR